MEVSVQLLAGILWFLDSLAECFLWSLGSMDNALCQIQLAI